MATYPLRDNAADELRTFSERPLSDITAEAIAKGELSGDDLRTHADALRQQARIAQDAGYPQLAGNLSRAAELTSVPSDELLRIYELRPDRATHEELSLPWSQRATHPKRRRPIASAIWRLAEFGMQMSSDSAFR